MLIDSLIRFSVRNKFVIGLLVLALIGWGIWALNRLPIDAVPDITNNQVQVITISPTLAPQEVEQYITVPVELSLANVPGVEEIRSVSKFGLSVITVVFEEDYPVLDARQLVNEQLPIAAEEIPAGLGTPRMMPITTGLGEIFQYVLVPQPGYEQQYDAMELRTIQDWVVKRYLNGIDGVVEISSFGGFVKQYEVALIPERMRALDVTIPEVQAALLQDNQNVGSAYIEQDGRAFYLRGLGLLTSMEEIEQVKIPVDKPIPVYIRDVANVREGFPPRYGAMTRNGQGEAVGGITLMLKGANSDAVIQRVKDRIAGIQEVLPEGLELHPYLDRSALVERTTSTVTNNLLEGGLIVIFVLVLMLGNLRAGLIVASVIPLSLLFAFGMMDLFGVSANLMSLGAIDFGLIVDGAVILVEATIHRLRHRFSGQRLSRDGMDEAVIEATSRIRKSAAFGEIIILMVYLPLLGLQGVEGKMFIPMAQTVSFAILGALILSLTYVPMAASAFLSRTPTTKRTFSDRLIDGTYRLYSPVLRWALRFRTLVLVTSLVVLGGSLWIFSNMGGEFIPQLDEGDLAIQMSLPPGSSLSQSIRMSTELEQILLANFPDEVKEVVSKIGTAEIPSDPMGVEDADIMIILQPRDQWTQAEDRYGLVEKMEAALAPLAKSGDLALEFTQPIELRFNELLTGSKSDIAIKIYGEDLAELARLGEAAVEVISPIPGAADVRLSRTEGFPQLIIAYNRPRLAALGLSVAEVNTSIRAAYAGMAAGVILQGDRRFDLVLRLSPSYRQDVEALGELQLRRPGGSTIPLHEVADIRFEEGPMLIQRDDTRRQVTIGVNVRGRDVEQLVGEIQETLARERQLPAGYAYFYGGEFEQLQSASRRLMITVPIVLFLIFSLLYFTFGSFGQAILIFTAIPMSAIGGILALWLRDMPFSISAGVGFIALFGVAVLNGIVLIGYLNELKQEGVSDLQERIVQGTKVRLRPVLMTALVASLGFLPMALSTGAGAEVQRPLATVVIGGLVTATLLTLVLLPILYSYFEKWQSGHKRSVIMVLLLLAASPATFAQAPAAPLTEAEALERAEEHAPAMRLADQQRAEVLAREQGMWQPGETQIIYQRGQLNTSAMDDFVTIEQPLGRPWAVPIRKQAWRAELGAAEARHGLASKQIGEQISGWYARWSWLQAQHTLADTIIARYQRLAHYQSARVAAGQDLGLAASMTRTALGQWELKRRQLNREQQQIQLALQTWLQLPVLPEPVTPTEQKRRLSLTQDSLLAAWSQTSEARQLAQNQQQLAAETRLRQAEYTPQLSAGWFGQTLDRQPGFSGFQIGIGLPLWLPAQSAKVQSLRVQEATLTVQQQIAEQAYRQQALDLWRQYQQQAESLEYYENEVLPESREMLAIAEARYRRGEMGFPEFHRYLTEAESWEQRYLDHLYEYNLTIIALTYHIR